MGGAAPCFGGASVRLTRTGRKGLYATLLVAAAALNTANNLLYLLLFTMPGVPSIYYGSEFGLSGRRMGDDDSALRPCLSLDEMQKSAPQPLLPRLIARLSTLRTDHPALRYGDYEQMYVTHEQLAFLRRCEQETLVTLLNACDKPATFEFNLSFNASSAVDLLNEDRHYEIKANHLRIEHVEPRWGRILKISNNGFSR